jgi:hypothetical protein
LAPTALALLSALNATAPVASPELLINVRREICAVLIKF